MNFLDKWNYSQNLRWLHIKEKKDVSCTKRNEHQPDQAFHRLRGPLSVD